MTRRWFWQYWLISLMTLTIFYYFWNYWFLRINRNLYMYIYPFIKIERKTYLSIPFLPHLDPDRSLSDFVQKSPSYQLSLVVLMTSNLKNIGKNKLEWFSFRPDFILNYNLKLITLSFSNIFFLLFKYIRMPLKWDPFLLSEVDI